MNFVAIDFETANYFRDSACAVGLVKVENNIITEKRYFLINPHSKWFKFTYLHNIGFEDVKDQPDFKELWPEIFSFIGNAKFLAAHNASFDFGVLKACCEKYDITMPKIPFKCTVDISRSLWKIYPTKLNLVCRHFDIPLDHHNAISDAEACAAIMIKAIKHKS